MSSDVYTKSEILSKLSAKGFFIDAYTLDTFLNKWKVESIFEDEQGSEFYDKSTLDLILNNLFKNQQEDEKNALQDVLIPTHEAKDSQPTPAPTPAPTQPQVIVVQQQAPRRPVFNDPATAEILQNIPLSDGSPLINKIPDIPIPNTDILGMDDLMNTSYQQPAPQKARKEKKKMGILEGAMISAGQEYKTEEDLEDMSASDPNSDFDDISLLSESLEAQEKFKEYVLSEMQKKNSDFVLPQVQQNGEFKLDETAERTLTVIAKAIGKKIAKYVATAVTQNNSPELAEQNKKLEKRTKELEEQNRKLKLLLAESNKNLNSFKPSIFGLYKKVPPSK